jgi:hypothetical protein
MNVVSGYKFKTENVDDLHEVLATGSPEAETIREFLTHLTVCHSVIPQRGKFFGATSFSAVSSIA